MDALEQAHRRGRVVGVLALILVLLFGATIGASFGHSGAGHHLLGQAANHEAWSGGPDEQHPLVLHTEGEQVETPDADGTAVAHSTSLTLPTLLVVLLDDRPAGGRAAPAPQRAELQVWRT
ncbi:hypothetical protein ACFFX1_02470 [Dactylosporangium sucinum]|uniref:Uncharacterized protein n=1 Tax=Dactylosporangium sucinum TaxID=1424081 RepID=A0A917T1N2_9ACTN|nr:hypothetical protein [Dactylosporangium sucinum]GGM07634.1 hypothetical protein GCM10007977_005860 [Dactylosporangium sucinum]